MKSLDHDMHSAAQTLQQYVLRVMQSDRVRRGQGGDCGLQSY